MHHVQYIIFIINFIIKSS